MKTEDDFKAEVQDLLVQFGQAILYGPPGTGKTRLARGVAAKILRLASVDELEGEKERFQFVQFHPSYNYEDFVRGIRMETDDNGRVAYKTENRVFGKMAERALANKGEPHVLVIDEINRANVSAVLGELIYGLEYRGKKVQTPYEVDGGYGLTVPSNLKVIGTMNTADRTIGQIDYAVRRRFAFVQCLPEPSVVADARAKEFFEMVDGVFVHLSVDHDKEDVCIGHSYFLASGPELANKIIYQVVPILREYLKDGVLGKEAKPKIDATEEAAKNLGKSVKADEVPIPLDGNRWFWWHKKSGRYSYRAPLRRMILNLVTDYAKHNRESCRNLQELQNAFPDKLRAGHGVVRLADDNDVTRHEIARYFRDPKDQIQLPDGTKVVVCNEWGAKGTEKTRFVNFKKHVDELGYIIHRDVELLPFSGGMAMLKKSPAHDSWLILAHSRACGVVSDGTKGLPPDTEREVLKRKGILVSDGNVLRFTEDAGPYRSYLAEGMITGTHTSGGTWKEKWKALRGD